jgi:hypothetical protein
MIEFRDIEEFPYDGKVTRIIESTFGDDEELIVYEGKMDVNLSQPESGSTAKTSSYVIDLPLSVKDGVYYNPVRTNDIITVTVFGETFDLEVDNSIASMLGGITVYAKRKSWE